MLSHSVTAHSCCLSLLLDSCMLAIVCMTIVILSIQTLQMRESRGADWNCMCLFQV